jgi:7,8-dihydroneopterin aldolase/epimerase/oxygenase
MMHPKVDQIVISQLAISTFIGVTDEEQKRPQRLRVSLVLETRHGFARLQDRIENTVDYDSASRAVKALATQGKRRLIETLAEEIAALLLEKFPLQAVEVELRKYILPDTEFVAVRIRREA